jgi:hypothetical protein
MLAEAAVTSATTQTAFLAACLVFTLPVAACGGTTDAEIHPSDGGNPAGDDGSGTGDTGSQPCGSNEPGPVRLATGQSPSAIAVVGGNVYWIDSALGTVNVVSACGGAPTTLVTTSTLGSSTLIPAGIAVEGGEVYFTTQDPWNPDGNDGAVWQVPSTGGTPAMLVQGLDRPGPILVSGASMYWIESWQTHSDDGQIIQAPLDGSSMNILADALNGPLALTLGGGDVVWTTAGYVDSERGYIFETPMGGGLVDGFAAAQNMPVGIAVQGKNAYWADQGDPNVNNSGSIMMMPLDYSAMDPVTLASGGVPRGIAVDGADAFWTDAQSQSVNEIPLVGGPTTTLATKQVAPLAIAVDDASVYWTTQAEGKGQGSVMRIAK